MIDARLAKKKRAISDFVHIVYVITARRPEEERTEGGEAIALYT